MIDNVPNYWKSDLDDIEDILPLIKRGNIKSESMSAGGRSIYLISYGKENSHQRMANLSSALGAGDASCYKKVDENYTPVFLIVGGTHGGEFEGIAAILNLISIFETGKDFRGETHKELYEMPEHINVIIIPCINPDGRARVPFKSVVGMSFEDFRYYDQGTWKKDGSLCEWPDCKKIHPIKEYVDFMGGYFNDDGVNLMHDNFFTDPTSECRTLFSITDKYAPDFSVLLHGGTNCTNCILKPAYASLNIKEMIYELELKLKKRCENDTLPYCVMPVNEIENDSSNKSFNLLSAMTQICGAPCVTYESNQGLDYGSLRLTHDEIYKHHLNLFEEIYYYIKRT